MGNEDDGSEDIMIFTSFVGNELGVAIGSRLGRFDGTEDCSFNGELLGSIDGICDGSYVGKVLCFVMGYMDGRMLGVPLGSWFGT